MRLELRNVSVRYGAIQAVRDVSLAVESGTVAAILGANGAGKSTLMRAITGLVPLAGGDILIDDRSIGNLPTEQRIRAGIALSPEGRRLFPEMTVQDNLMSGAYLRQDPRGVRADLEMVHVLFPRLTERQHSLGRNLSGGEQQMVAIGRALMAAPKLLLLDEPSLGLAPQIVDQIFELIAGLRERGLTILLVEQNVALSLEIADAGYVMANGLIVLSGSSAELRNSSEIQGAYLGA